MDDNKEEKPLLPHHEQMPLCTTRLPYRQGRKLTAVKVHQQIHKQFTDPLRGSDLGIIGGWSHRHDLSKVYTINDESNHLLIFGVPSLNLRQETKALFCKFGKLIHFAITDKHASEIFTETYHATFERIQSARAAKRMLDTKNFYGGSLHVCYAPELESLEETRQKLMQRRKEVFVRLKKNHEKSVDNLQHELLPESRIVKSKLMNMGENNIIMTTPNIRKRKTCDEKVICKKSKLNVIPVLNINPNATSSTDGQCSSTNNNQNMTVGNTGRLTPTNIEPDIGLDINTCSNVSECNKIELNYSDFGKEIIKKIPEKPLNRIKFYVNKKYNGSFIVSWLCPF